MLAFAQGAGANGKSVFINTIAGLLGDYHRTANMETFTASMHEQHRTHIAYLRGARLVTATETEHGRRWAEARIKEMTGGERLQANYMRQDPFEFVPQFTLLIAGNHRPGLRAVDEAVRRRFHLIPFRVTIPPAERDLELPERLRAEWPGTLAWMIEGCLEWQRRGLDPPRAVVEATSSYLEEEDAVATWIDERCQVHPNYWAASGALYGSWLIWAEAAGVYVLNEKAIVQALENRGFTRRRTGGVRGIQGLRIVADL
jgi:putative DNA primase/helicase